MKGFVPANKREKPGVEQGPGLGFHPDMWQPKQQSNDPMQTFVRMGWAREGCEPSPEHG